MWLCNSLYPVRVFVMRKKIVVQPWDTYWNLSIIEEVEWVIRKKGSPYRKFKCKCNCWKVTYVLLHRLRSWNTKSCWCLMIEKNTKHWMSYTRFYNIWRWIRCRCENTNRKESRLYILKWITRYKRRDTFLNFKKDMYKSYLEHKEKYWENQTTIDRIDNNWNYCKNNCRRATYKVQNNNQRYKYKQK